MYEIALKIGDTYSIWSAFRETLFVVLVPVLLSLLLRRLQSVLYLREMPTEGITVLAVDSHGTKLRQALVERIKMFRNFNPNIYETCELEDIHDLILDFEDLMWNINKKDTIVSPNHKKSMDMLSDAYVWSR